MLGIPKCSNPEKVIVREAEFSPSLLCFMKLANPFLGPSGLVGLQLLGCRFPMGEQANQNSWFVGRGCQGITNNHNGHWGRNNILCDIDMQQKKPTFYIAERLPSRSHSAVMAAAFKTAAFSTYLSNKSNLERKGRSRPCQRAREEVRVRVPEYLLRPKNSLSVCLSVCPSVRLSACLFVHPSCLSVSPQISQSVHGDVGSTGDRNERCFFSQFSCFIKPGKKSPCVLACLRTPWVPEAYRPRVAPGKSWPISWKRTLQKGESSLWHVSTPGCCTLRVLVWKWTLSNLNSRTRSSAWVPELRISCSNSTSKSLSSTLATKVSVGKLHASTTV